MRAVIEQVNARSGAHAADASSPLAHPTQRQSGPTFGTAQEDRVIYLRSAAKPGERPLLEI
ncbi:MAG TPA: hypothetical protein VGX92_13085 [Pyrinomonadaceae bacterium]|jgi:hypothetical protein|nr:hypothetical protein [Pyrinomonadaceae bacterium]